MCVDRAGDIFVANLGGETIVEYAHGGKTSIETLKDNGTPNGCAIDPTTGDLAVTNNCDGPEGSCYPSGTILIYKNAKRTPKALTDPYSAIMLYCAYDKDGNLFVSGSNGGYASGFAEMRRGSTTFTSLPITLPKKVWQPGGLQWVGKYLAVAPGDWPVLSTRKYANGVVEVFKYPAGGDPTKVVTKSLDFPWAAVVSPAKT